MVKSATIVKRMKTRQRPPAAATVDAYIRAFPAPVQEKLRELRALIREEAPEAEERIGWGMPAYRLHGTLLFFAAYPRHIGFYPLPGAIAAFAKELAKYKQAKGSVRFPLDRPLPLPLIRRMVRFRVRENRQGQKKLVQSKS